MKQFPFASLAAVLTLSACASFPELDGKPTGAMRAAEFQTTSAAPVWRMDFGDPTLRRMLAEADRGGLDAATARIRFRAADMALDQARISNSGLNPTASGSVQGGQGGAINASVSYEPDLAGRFDAALQGAQLEHRASGIELLIARRTLAREVTRGWIALAEARTTASSARSDVAAEEKSLRLLRLRRDAGEATGADISAREQSLIRLRASAASATGQIALAEARLRALGVTSVPRNTSLKGARRPAVPDRTDLGVTQSSPQVCATWLRFVASDAARAETLAASRPRLVLTSSLSATAKTLAGLIAGNAAAVTNSVRLEGDILGTGESRRRVDKARLDVASAEIEWLRARNQHEIGALEAITARQSAEASLTAALAGWKNAQSDLGRARARLAAGEADALDIAEAERGLNTAQREIDNARAEALRAAVTQYDALPEPVAACQPAARAAQAQTL